MIGITGQKTSRFNDHLGQWLGGTLPKDALDITVRATGEDYVL